MSGTAIADPRPTLMRTTWIVALAALELLVIAAGLVYRQVALRRLEFELEARAYSVAQRFGDTTWPQVRAFALGAGDLDADDLRASPEVATIGRRLAALSEGLAVVEAKVYAKDGTVLYASDPATIGGTVTDETVVQMLADAYYDRGRTDAVSRLRRVQAPGVPCSARWSVCGEAQASGADGAPRSLNVVTTLAALRDDTAEVKGGVVVAAPYGVSAVLEISQDATAEVRRVSVTLAIVVALAFVVSATILVLGIRRQARSNGEASP